jgi:hypothetical protein
VPTSEINCPPKKSWKLRCRNERNAAGSLRDDLDSSEGWVSFMGTELDALREP